MDERERERREPPRAVEATASDFVVAKPCCGEPVRLERDGRDLSAERQVSCPDCPLALFAPFELTVTLRREAGGGLGAAGRLRCACPWVWEDGWGGGDASAEGCRLKRAVRAQPAGRGRRKASSRRSRPAPRGGAGGSRKARRRAAP